MTTSHKKLLRGSPSDKDLFTPERVEGFSMSEVDSSNYFQFQHLAQNYDVLTLEQETAIIKEYCDAQESAVALLAKLVYPVQAYLAATKKVTEKSTELSGGRKSQITFQMEEVYLKFCTNIAATKGPTQKRHMAALARELSTLDYRHIAGICHFAREDKYAQQVPWLPAAEAKAIRKQCWAHIQVADHNVDKLFNHNIRLFLRVAHDFSRQPHLRLHKDDLVQEGSLGLVAAIQKYSRGQRKHDGGDNKLSGWATLWIKHYIRRWCDKMSHSISRPVRKSERLRKLIKILAQRRPPMEMADLIGMNDEQLKDLSASFGERVMGPEEIAELRELPNTTSLNAPVGEEGEGGGAEVGDMIADQDDHRHGYVNEGFIDRDAKVAILHREVQSMAILPQIIITTLYGTDGRGKAFFDYADRTMSDYKARATDLLKRLEENPARPVPSEMTILSRSMKIY